MGKDTKNTIQNQHLSQRDAFWREVGNQMESDPDIVIVVADMSSPVFDEIRRKFPHRFINVGIAEQNAVAVAAGLAMKGKKVFVYAIASFMVLRCFEQIRVNCSIMNLPITIVGVGAGFSYDDSGPTHHLFEDVAVMRTLPNMVIHSISDNQMAVDVAKHSANNMNNPNYVRLERHITENISPILFDDNIGYRFMKPMASNIAIITTGYMNKVALEVEKEINISIVDAYQIPFAYNELFLKLIKSGINVVYVLEENFKDGGLGSYVLENMSQLTLGGYKLDFVLLGMDKKWVYEYGGRESNQRHHGIDAQSVVEKIRLDNR